jgi:hypothetical protein
VELTSSAAPIQLQGRVPTGETFYHRWQKKWLLNTLDSACADARSSTEVHATGQPEEDARGSGSLPWNSGCARSRPDQMNNAGSNTVTPPLFGPDNTG